MARLRGMGLGAGMAMGTAAVVQVRSGAAMMPEIPARLASLIAQRRLTEIPDVILVAQDYRMARAIAPSLAWAKVVGFAAENDEPDAPVSDAPAVVGVSGLMRAASDDVLILVDATRGAVLVDPDPVYLAQYTAEHDRIAPKNRLYMDEAHLPAYSLDGKAITIIADARGHDIEQALASGADALYCPLPITFDPADLRRDLAPLIESVGGKPLIFSYNSSLPLGPVLEFAARSDITLTVSPPDESAFSPEADTIARLLEEIALLQAEYAEQDIVCGTPRIAAEMVFRDEAEWPPGEEISQQVVPLGGSPPAFAGSINDPALGRSAPTVLRTEYSENLCRDVLESLTAQGVTRLLFYGSVVSASHMQQLVQLCAFASANLVPVSFHIRENSVPLETPDADFASNLPHSLALLIGAGISGFLVDIDLAQPAKQAIRAISASESEEELRRWITEVPNS